MKKIAFFAKSILLCSAITIASCSGNESNNTPVTNDSTANAGTVLNIRFIDGDSVTAHYNLALDFKEASIRTMSKLENAQRAKAAEIQKFGSQIEQKMKSNGYLSEASYNADVQKFNKMQSDAQGYLATLERNAQQELLQQQMQLNDSIDSFIKDYNAKHGYDAILFKNAGVYFNPALDITNEVIEGLNARYNKVEK
ncbi:MAG: OmpH family outer membrane protein [Muribaculaceae bacterium]|nr:OmpH family outer membrane protein [Muribaculaceae bacterium]